MSNDSPKKQRKAQRLTSVLGLTLDGSRLEGVVLRRTNGSLHQAQTLSVTLSLDPLTAAPELVGREIRNHLAAAGIRERSCVLGLPLKWILTAHTDIPAELPPDDIRGFLDLEAERAFPCDASTLQIGFSVATTPSGSKHALLAGIPKNHLNALEQVLSSAKLKPIGFSVPMAALQPPDKDPGSGVLALAIGETQVGLGITAGGGMLALRALEGALETEGSRRLLNKEFIGREARITLGQLPPEVRETVKRIRIFGPRDLAQELADDLELRLEASGLEVEVVTRYEPALFSAQLPSDAAVSISFSLAARALTKQAPVFEFLPPRVTAWEQVVSRYSSGKLRLVGAAAAGVALLALGAFVFQQWQLVHLRNQWTGMSAKVKDLKNVQSQIAQYRPWFDENCRGLAIMRELTEAFPDDGVVTAKTVEIRNLGMVTCTGQTRDYQALVRILDKLGASKGITDVRLSSIRGKSPMQFTFDFRCNEGGSL